MALTDDSNMVLPVQPMNGGSGFGGFGGDLGWIIIFLLFGMFNGGWGNGGFGGGFCGDGLYPWMNNSQNINNGFRDQMLNDNITSIRDGVYGINNQLCSGFAGVTASVTGAQNALAQQMYANQLSDLERSFAAQTASTQGMNSIQAQLAQCCCENRQATADTKYTVLVYSDAFLYNYSETVPKEERIVNVSKSHTVYTVNHSGVAFGRDLLFSATEKSIVVTFLGGSKFDNVTEVGYTIGLWDDNQSTSDATYSGTYVIGENNKRFEMFKDTGDWKFVIDDERMNNVLGQTYIVALSFKVIDGENEYYYDSITNPEFAGKAQYVKDNN